MGHTAPSMVRCPRPVVERRPRARRGAPRAHRSYDVMTMTRTVGHILSRRALLSAAAALAASGAAGCLAGCVGGEGGAAAPAPSPTFRDTDLGCDLGTPRPRALAHATRLTIDDLDGGLVLLCLANGERLLVVPEGVEAPGGLADGVAVVRQPLEGVYLVSTAMACVLEELGALGAVGFSSMTAESCPSEGLAALIEGGEVAFGGRYSAPDYERLVAAGCPLALENNKVGRVPEVARKLRELGMVVVTEQSSDEPEVLGRVEWARLVGALFGRDAEAEALLERVGARVAELSSLEPTGRTIAFFYVNSDGAVATRRSSDYFSRLVELAGGTYLSFDPAGGAGDEAGSSQLVVDMEAFYAGARDADVIVYNTTVDASVASVADLVAKSALLADFRAVRSGEVWACDHYMYQRMTEVDAIASEIRGALEGTGGDGRFLWRLG